MKLVQCTNSWVRVLMLVLLATVMLQAGEQGKEKPPATPYDVSGDVVDLSGTGVAGVSIVFLKATPPNSKDGIVTTDAKGHFTRKGLPGNQAYYLVPEKGKYQFSPAKASANPISRSVKFVMNK